MLDVSELRFASKNYEWFVELGFNPWRMFRDDLSKTLTESWVIVLCPGSTLIRALGLNEAGSGFNGEIFFLFLTPSRPID